MLEAIGVLVLLAGSHEPQVAPELVLELELDGLLGSQGAQVEDGSELLLLEDDQAPHDAGSAELEAAGEDQASHSLVCDLYGQLVWVGAQEVMVTSAVAVMVVVLPAVAAPTRATTARVERILDVDCSKRRGDRKVNYS